MLKKNDWILLVITLVSALGIWLVLPSLPDQIPMHWNLQGQVDDYGSKAGFMGLSLLPLGLLLMFVVLPYIDPKRENYDKHAKAYAISKYLVVLLLVSISWITVLFLKGVIQEVDTIIIMAVGILFTVLGNYMPQIRHNYFFGIKTPWTLANETVWNKTHRVGGTIFVILGLSMLATALFYKTGTFYVMIVGAPLMVLGTGVYSYVLFKKIERTKVTGDKESIRIKP